MNVERQLIGFNFLHRKRLAKLQLRKALDPFIDGNLKLRMESVPPPRMEMPCPVVSVCYLEMWGTAASFLMSEYATLECVLTHWEQIGIE